MQLGLITYVGVAVTIWAYATYRAMGARVDITDVPWWTFVRRPSYFGGRDELLKGIGWLLVWWIVSIAIGILLAWAISSSESLVQYTYRAFGETNPDLGHAGPITCIAFSYICYVYIVSRTHSITEQQAKRMPRAALKSPISSRDLVRVFHSYIGANRSKRYRLPFMLLLDTLPIFLVPFYRYFYDSSGILLRGCVNLLLERYGKKTIIDFYDFHRRHSDDPRLKELNERVAAFNQGSADHARAILFGKMRMKGYVVLKRYINNYVKVRAEDKDFQEKRSIGRGFFESCPKLHCDNSGLKIKVQLV